MVQNNVLFHESTYKVHVKSNQSTHQWKDFDVARLPISIGHHTHEEEKLKATFRWCRERFRHVQICVNDTLQRYNLMFQHSISEQEAYDLALSKGDIWINRNKPLFSLLSSYECVRWDQWRQHPEFLSVMQKIQNLYNMNKEFKEAIDKNALDVWKRRTSVNSSDYCANRMASFLDFSVQYLLEEVAVFSLMFEETRAIDIYPGSGLLATDIFSGRPLPGAPEGMSKRHFCRIDFLRRSPKAKDQKADYSTSPLPCAAQS